MNHQGTEGAAVIGHNSGGRVQCIFRGHGERGYTKLKNTFLQDRRISDETRGLVARLLSLPTDWEVTVKSIIASGKAGRDKVYRMIAEAEEFGYIKPDERSRTAKGNFDRQLYLVSDDPAALVERAAEELLAMEEAENSFELPAPTDNVTYVYVLQRDDLCKIGITRHPKNRIAHINYTSGKSPAEPCHIRASTKWQAEFIERGAHLRLSARHVEGEWFKCTPEEAINAVEWAASVPCRDNPDVDKTAENKATQPRPDYPDTGSPYPVEPRPGAPLPEDQHVVKDKDIYKNNNNPPIVPPDEQTFDLQADEAEAPKKRARDAIPDEYPYDFEEFWKVYPRREGKALAFKRWKKLNLGQKRRAYVALKRQLEFLTAKTRDRNGNLCPHAATWLNQGRFDDDPAPAEPAAPPGRFKSYADQEAERVQKFIDACNAYGKTNG